MPLDVKNHILIAKSCLQKIMSLLPTKTNNIGIILVVPFFGLNKKIDFFIFVFYNNYLYKDKYCTHVHDNLVQHPDCYYANRRPIDKRAHEPVTLK